MCKYDCIWWLLAIRSKARSDQFYLISILINESFEIRSSALRHEIKYFIAFIVLATDVHLFSSERYIRSAKYRKSIGCGHKSLASRTPANNSSPASRPTYSAQIYRVCPPRKHLRRISVTTLVVQPRLRYETLSVYGDCGEIDRALIRLYMQMQVESPLLLACSCKDGCRQTLQK